MKKKKLLYINNLLNKFQKILKARNIELLKIYLKEMIYKQYRGYPQILQNIWMIFLGMRMMLFLKE